MQTVLCAVLMLAVSSLAAIGADKLSEELKRLPDRILYESYVDDNWELFVMDADGSNKRNLTNTKEVHEHYPQASPDGAKICFLADTGSGRDTLRHVYYMPADGGERVLVAEKSRQPCWSPDSRKIAFVKQEFPEKFTLIDYASKGLFIYDLATEKTEEVVNKKVHHLYNPNWSSDGRWIVSTVHAGMGFKHGIIAIEIGGHKVVNLKLGGCRPCLRSDGREVVWSNDDHTVSAATLDFSGPEPKVTDMRVIDHRDKEHLYHPDFSPDGKYITYSVGPGGRVPADGPGTFLGISEIVGVRGKWDLHVRRADGQGEILQLTHDPSTSNKESEWLPAVKK